MRRRIQSLIMHIILVFISILFLLPVVWMIIVALKPENAPVTQIPEWFNLGNYTLDNFRKILSNPQFKALRWMGNSLFVSTAATILILCVCSLAAYGFSAFNFKLKGFWTLVIGAGMMVPQEAVIVPMYVLMYNMDMLDTKQALILPAIAMPMAFIILRNFFNGLPRELFDAAKIDGCGYFRIFIKIVLPLSKTALSTVAIFAFMGTWNDFMWPFLSIYSQDQMTVPIGIMLYISENMTERTMPLTAGALLSIPVLIVFALLQKNIIKGVAMTGIKG